MSYDKQRKNPGVSAWLVTWEPSADLDRDAIAAVFSSRTGAENVRRMVELLYSYSEHCAIDKINRGTLPSYNPHPATFVSISGVPWQGQIQCGYNPFLFARLVDELRIECKADGVEQAIWIDRPKPK